MNLCKKAVKIESPGAWPFKECRGNSMKCHQNVNISYLNPCFGGVLGVHFLIEARFKV